MPELPEVEKFRQLLEPLVGPQPLSVELVGKNPPRKFLSKDEVASIDTKFRAKEIQRKGKVICMHLESTKGKKAEYSKYLFLHMGMTGRISTPEHVPSLESLPTTDYPPPHTYLRFKTIVNGSTKAEACFSDPRKFGSAILADSLDAEFGELAVDGLEFNDTSVLTEQSMRIKALLLDQRRALCGVGNWVADEVLYQSEIHPDQNYLTASEGQMLQQKITEVLSTACDCLSKGQDFPSSWLFSQRWSKRSSKKETVKDSQGRSILFIKAGGRTSAIVPTIQKLKSRTKPTNKRIRDVENVPDGAVSTNETTEVKDSNQEESPQKKAKKASTANGSGRSEGRREPKGKEGEQRKHKGVRVRSSPRLKAK